MLASRGHQQFARIQLPLLRKDLLCVLFVVRFQNLRVLQSTQFDVGPTEHLFIVDDRIAVVLGLLKEKVALHHVLTDVQVP